MKKVKTGDEMNVINIKKYFKNGDFVIFIAVFFSSIVGAQILGVSLNKIALIPLELFLLFKMPYRININQTQKLFFLWYIFSVCSCFTGICMSYSYKIERYSNSLIAYLMQFFLIYMPCILLINKIPDVDKKFDKAIVLVAKINAIWGIIQFICWYVLKLDFSDLVFNQILHGLIGSEWTAWNFEMGSPALRIGGLNRDTAFYSIILIFGFCLTNKLFWKIIFFGACLLSLSRAGIVGICICLVIELFKKDNMKITHKKMTAILFIVLSGLLAIFFIFSYSSSIQYQMKYMLYRFSSIFNNVDIGTNRHIVYLGGGLDTWIKDYTIIQKLFGTGPRAGGIGLQLNKSLQEIIGVSGTVWSIECDYIEILLGHGILGYTIYFVLWRIFRFGKTRYKSIIIALLVLCILYNYMDLTLIQLWLMCLFPNVLLSQSKKQNLSMSGDEHEPGCKNCVGNY